jgi:hypothetical protein
MDTTGIAIATNPGQNDHHSPARATIASGITPFTAYTVSGSAEGETLAAKRLGGTIVSIVEHVEPRQRDRERHPPADPVACTLQQRWVALNS